VTVVPPSSAGVKLNQLSPAGTITSGALPTVQLVSGTAAQINTGRDVETHTPVTCTPTAGASATCAIAISPDDTTFSTLVTLTVPAGVALDGFILDARARVPAGWYLKLTANAQAALGVTTSY
jgi:hypothetical protein